MLFVEAVQGVGVMWTQKVTQTWPQGAATLQAVTRAPGAWCARGHGLLCHVLGWAPVNYGVGRE